MTFCFFIGGVFFSVLWNSFLKIASGTDSPTEIARGKRGKVEVPPQRIDGVKSKVTVVSVRQSYRDSNGPGGVAFADLLKHLPTFNLRGYPLCTVGTPWCESFARYPDTLAPVRGQWKSLSHRVNRVFVLWSPLDSGSGMPEAHKVSHARNFLIC